MHGLCLYIQMTNSLAGFVCAQPLPHCAPRWSRMKLPRQAFLSSLPCHVLCVPFPDESGSRMDLLNSLGGIQLMKESDFLFLASSPLKESQCSPKLTPLWLLLAESTGPASVCCHQQPHLGRRHAVKEWSGQEALTAETGFEGKGLQLFTAIGATGSKMKKQLTCLVHLQWVNWTIKNQH